MKTAIVCMAKDEDPYIDEWIDYHHRLGFDDFYICRDNWDGMTEMMKKDFCHVYDVKDVIDNQQIEEFDLKQVELYGKVLDKIIDQYDFAAVIDVDEFINLRQYKGIKEFLENYLDVHAVVLNWFMFGDSHLSSVQDGNYSCINRFVYHAKNIHNCVKTIYNLKEISKAGIKLNGLVGVHHVKDFSKLSVCTLNKTRCTTSTVMEMQENKISSAKIAYINHYGVKTLEEYRKKYERNFTSKWEKKNRWKFNGFEGRFQADNWNIVFDDSLKNRYAEMKSQDDNASIIEH